MYTPTKITLVEEAIMRAANVTLEQIRSPIRDKQYVEARQAVWYICHEHLGFSYPELAKVYQRDHTTILSGVRKMRNGDVGKRVLEQLQKTRPEIFEERKGTARTVDNWRF